MTVLSIDVIIMSRDFMKENHWWFFSSPLHGQSKSKKKKLKFITKQFQKVSRCI